MAAQVEWVSLNNGSRIPKVGLGTWKSTPKEVVQAVKYAIDVGYRHFDCAYAYQNEKEVGVALKDKIDEGVVRRVDLWITSKLWSTFHKPELVKPSLKETLTNLGLDYIDLYLVHWPQAFKEGGDLFPRGDNGKLIFSDVDYLDTWKALEECVDQGLCKSIGVSNFNSEQLERVLKNCRIKPVTNQIECHPYLNQKNLIRYCNERGVTITAYSPLGSPDHPFLKEKPDLLHDPKLVEIAKRYYGKSPAQILLRYQLQLGNIVIPKSVSRMRIEENIQIFDFELTPDDFETLNNFDLTFRLCKIDDLKDEKYYPFDIEY